LPEQPDTYIEVDLGAEHTLTNADLQTRCGWNPFVGAPLVGRVERVVLRGQVAYETQQVLAPPGRGSLIPQSRE